MNETINTKLMAIDTVTLELEPSGKFNFDVLFMADFLTKALLCHKQQCQECYCKLSSWLRADLTDELNSSS